MTNEEKQQLREAVIEYLAKRPAAKFTVSTITRMVSKRGLIDFDVTEQDVAEALAVLEGYAFVSADYPKFGSVKQYQATSEGVMFHERGE